MVKTHHLANYAAKKEEDKKNDIPRVKRFFHFRSHDVKSHRV